MRLDRALKPLELLFEPPRDGSRDPSGQTWHDLGPTALLVDTVRVYEFRIQWIGFGV